MSKLLTGMDESSNHLMIDIETLATTANAHILEIGCVLFRLSMPNRPDFLAEYEAFCYQKGRVIDKATKKWWQKEQPMGWKRQVGARRESLEEVLGNLAVFCKVHEVEYIWANSPTFDLVILEDAYKQYGIPVPWTYRMQLDYRTIRLLTQVSYDDFKATTHYEYNHSALDDAKYQAAYLQHLFK